MKSTLLHLLFLLMSVYGFAQRYTISGYVEEAETGERLLGANVYNANSPQQGTITNHYGFFSLTVPKGKMKLRVSFVGFENKEMEIDLQKNHSMTVQLSSNITLDEVVVTARRREVENTQMSKIDVPVEFVQKMPALLGEVDILKTIQLLPGVQGGTEGTSGIYVRGGGPDQNLILLDGVPVYNASHLFGFFSVFNSSAISDISLIKGGFPARYSGRLSSVLDIRMKEGNMKKFKGEFDIGIISSKLTLEGPIIKDKTSFIVSGRRTYIDILAAPFIKRSTGEEAEMGYFFHDVNAKVNHKFSDRDRLYLSFYTGLDKAKANSTEGDDSYQKNDLKFSMDWGNYTTALRWNHVFSPKLFSNTTLTYSRYQFNVDVADRTYEQGYGGDEPKEMNAEVGYYSGINDWAGRIDFEYTPSPVHAIRFGVSGIHHTFRPGITSLKYSETGEVDINQSFGEKDLNTKELDVYIEDEIRFSNWFTANLGIHGSSFLVRDTSFFSVQPRASLRFLVNDNWSVKASYASMRQYLHLLTNSTIGLPTDLWLPATDHALPQESQQVALGTVVQLSDHYSISLEGFYKGMDNLLEYKPGANFFSGFEETGGSKMAWEEKTTQGKGLSKGLELLVRKDLDRNGGWFGKLSGWIGYTLSSSTRQFDEIGKEFPYRYDRRHDINVMLTYQLSKKVDFGLTWVYGTGNAVTLQMQTYASLTPDLLSGGVTSGPGSGSSAGISYYEKRNNHRMEPYHRLDVGVNFHKKKKHGFRTWSIGVYNAYNRKNPFFVDFQDLEYGSDKLIQFSLFPIIPSVSYKYKF